MFLIQGLYAVMTLIVRLCFPWYLVHTKQPKPDVYDPVDRTLCVVIVVIIYIHPPVCHTLVASSSRL